MGSDVRAHEAHRAARTRRPGLGHQLFENAVAGLRADEQRAEAASHIPALIMQSDAPIFAQGKRGWACELKSLRESGDDYAQTQAAWLRLQDAVMWTERELFRSGYYLSVGFGALTCAMCEPCDVTELCKFPYSARPSMEAVGIDVAATLKRLGLHGGGDDGGGVLTGLVLAV